MKKQNIFMLIIALAALGGGYYAYSEYMRPNADLATAKVDVAISEADLVKAFIENETAANAKYDDKVIKVEGSVKSVDKDAAGLYTVVLGTAESENSVSCQIAKKHNEEVSLLKVGDKAIFQGRCAGYLDMVHEVSLVECALHK